MIKPSNFLYFPIRNGKWLQDSQGKPRVYKSVSQAVKNLKKHEYDHIQIYTIDDVLSREEFESEVTKYCCKCGQAIDWGEEE